MEPRVLGCEYPQIRVHGDLWRLPSDSTMLRLPAEGWFQAAGLAVARRP